MTPLETVIKRFSQELPVDPEQIREALPGELRRQTQNEAFLKLLISESRRYRERLQFGRLKATVIVGVMLRGDLLFRRVERAGLLLCDDMPKRKFRAFLQETRSAFQDSKYPGSSNARERLDTYITYERMADELTRGDRAIHRLLSKRPRTFLMKVLELANLYFLRHYLKFPLGDELDHLFGIAGSPEKLANIASLLTAITNKRQALDSLDVLPISPQLDTPDVHKALLYGKDMVCLRDTAKQISLFQYSLRQENGCHRIFTLAPPSADFEYSVRLGYIRAETGTQSIPWILNESPAVPRVSLRTLAEFTAETMKDRIASIRGAGTPFERIRVELPVVPELYEAIIKGGFYEDVGYEARLSKEFLLPPRAFEEKWPLTSTLDLPTFLSMWRVVNYMALMDIAVLRRYTTLHPTTVYRSLSRIFKETELVAALAELEFPCDSVREFIRLISADVQHLGFYDIQYRPFLRLQSKSVRVGGRLVAGNQEFLYLPGVVHCSNILRNVQVSNQIRTEKSADLFVAEAADCLRSVSPNVIINRRVKGNGNAEIDVIMMSDTTLYLFECKWSIASTGPQEMRDLWRDVEHAGEQLTKAVQILSDPDRRQSYIAGWFPGQVQKRQTVSLRIQTCILCSSPAFSGLTYQGIPVRDLGSLSRLMADGVMSIKSMDAEGNSHSIRFRGIRNDCPEIADLDDYLSPDAKYFEMTRPFMRPVTRLEWLSDQRVILAHETFVLWMDSDEWIQNMESLGFQRLPDEEKRLVFPDDFQKVMDSLRRSSAPN